LENGCVIKGFEEVGRNRKKKKQKKKKKSRRVQQPERGAGSQREDKPKLSVENSRRNIIRVKGNQTYTMRIIRHQRR